MSFKPYIRYKTKYDIKERKQRSQHFLKKYPGHVPVIVEPLSTSKLKPFQNCRFSVQKQKQLMYLKTTLLQKIQKDANQGIYMFVGNRLLQQSHAYIEEFYNKYKQQDGFLYLQYSQSNPF